MKMKRKIGISVKMLLLCMIVVLLGITSCSKGNLDGIDEGVDKVVEPTKPATLSERFKGSYICTIKTSKPKAGTVYAPDKLILFLTPTDDKAPDKLNIEIRMWVSSIMFHDLTFKAPVKLTEQANKIVKGQMEGKSIEYVVMGMGGKDKGDATIELSVDEKGLPMLKSVVILDGAYDYRMEFAGSRRSSKLLPGAVSTL